jgi:hypothetical protein
VRIPRCRATVSEEIATCHWEMTWEDWLQHPDAVAELQHSVSSLAKPGDRREPPTPTPFA